MKATLKERLAAFKTNGKVLPEYVRVKLYRGLNDKDLIYYTQGGPGLCRTKFADEVVPSIRHIGWFADTFQNDKHRGVIARLSHGRALAGYHCNDNDEYVWYPQAHDNERDAALMADEHARVSAEHAYENDEKYCAYLDLSDLIRGKSKDVGEAFALRNHHRLGKAKRAEALEILSDVRAFQAELQQKYSEFL